VTASANLDLVRSIVAPWERGDFSSLDWADPEIEYVIADGPSPGTWTGLAGMAESTRDWLSNWEDYRIVSDEQRELDTERVLVLFHRSSGRGKKSGLEVSQFSGTGRWQGAYIFHVRDGNVTRLVAYFDHKRALTDLGLAPEAG
jgi:ketosteroid isomerase-like protein